MRVSNDDQQQLCNASNTEESLNWNRMKVSIQHRNNEKKQDEFFFSSMLMELFPKEKKT